MLELLEAGERRRAIRNPEGLRQSEQQLHQLVGAYEVGAVRVEGGPGRTEVLELLGADALEEAAADLVEILHEDADEERDDHKGENHLRGQSPIQSPEVRNLEVGAPF